MAHEKLFTAKQAAQAVLDKTKELLEKSEFMKAEKMKKGNDMATSINSAVKEAQQARGSVAPPPLPQSVASSISSAFGKSEQPKGEIHPKEKEQAPSDEVRTQAAPEANPKEQAEGNNELAGTTPTQVGQDGKNLPGFDEMRGHLKLAKFIGHMGAKRKMKGAANG